MKVLTAAAIMLAATFGAHAAPGDIVQGNAKSDVRVLIYEDLQCSDCANFEAMLEQKVMPKYGSRVAFVHRDFPLGKHEWARPAAIAARWVFEQSTALGLQFRLEIMSEQNTITGQNLKSWLAEFAKRNKLDPKAIVDSLDDQRLTAIVDQDKQGGVARGISHTPTVYVGGVPLIETIPYEDMARALDQALGK